MTEIWKDITGYEGLYKVSNLGRVKRVSKNKVIKPWITRGYLLVRLSKNGKTKNFAVHRLVALLFLENPENLPEVNHKDENPSNNHVDNLEWCSHKYNMNYGNCQEKIRKGCFKPINCYDKQGKLIKYYESCSLAALDTGYSRTMISLCCKGRRSSKDYIFRYSDIQGRETKKRDKYIS